MNAQKQWGLGPLALNPWYHGYRATDVLYASGPAASVVTLSYGLYAQDGDRLYHHVVSINGTNPSYPPPAGSLEEMTPWTSEMLLRFIDHPQTRWSFHEAAWSEEVTEDGGEGVWSYYDEVYYHGPATLVPEPAELSLVALGALTLLRRRREYRRYHRLDHHGPGERRGGRRA